MKKSNENLIPLDFSPIEEQCRQLSETFRVGIAFLLIRLLRISFLANPPTSCRMGSSIPATFQSLERFPSTSRTSPKMDR